MSELPRLSMVIGGAASGKSDFAEQLVIADRRPHIYVATAQAFDDEMAAKIARHKAARAQAGWTTVEEPRQVAQTVLGLTDAGAVLIDCATLWLTNLIMDGADIAYETELLLDSLANSHCPVVIVTNETGQGIVPDNRMARDFRQQQGYLNRRIAAKANLVVQIVAGLPNVLKGDLPGPQE